ncbi:MAG: immunoglobulin-like domain-containing protein, partial [Acholeplasmataceae bacterium]
MKRLFRLLSVVLAVLLFLAACELDVPDQDPVIHGAVDKEIARGTAFVPLEGITAEDDEDGDLTEDIVYSGDVNPNVAGTYEANYTVTDSAGNTTTVTITITVVDVDTEAPLISGAGDIDLIVGDEDFDPMAGVVASDTVDGDVTTDLELTGEFDVWTPGEYV